MSIFKFVKQIVDSYIYMAYLFFVSPCDCRNQSVLFAKKRRFFWLLNCSFSSTMMVSQTYLLLFYPLIYQQNVVTIFFNVTIYNVNFPCIIYPLCHPCCYVQLFMSPKLMSCQPIYYL